MSDDTQQPVTQQVQTQQVPQDAPTSPPAWAPPVAAPPPAPAPRPVEYVPAPTGPNWSLVIVGVVLMAVAAGVVANQVSGFQVAQLQTRGPGALIGIGLLCALIGILGMARRRHRH